MPKMFVVVIREIHTRHCYTYADSPEEAKWKARATPHPRAIAEVPASYKATLDPNTWEVFEVENPEEDPQLQSLTREGRHPLPNPPTYERSSG